MAATSDHHVAWMYEGPGGALATEQLGEAYLLGQKAPPVAAVGEFAEVRASLDKLGVAAGVKLISKPVSAASEAFNVRAEDPLYALRRAETVASRDQLSGALSRYRLAKRANASVHDAATAHPVAPSQFVVEEEATHHRHHRRHKHSRDHDRSRSRDPHEATRHRHHGASHRGDGRSRSRERRDSGHRRRDEEPEASHRGDGRSRSHERRDYPRRDEEQGASHRGDGRSRSHERRDYPRRDEEQGASHRRDGRSRSRERRDSGHRRHDDGRRGFDRSSSRDRHALHGAGSDTVRVSPSGVASNTYMSRSDGDERGHGRYGLQHPLLEASELQATTSNGSRLLGPSQAMIASRTAALAASAAAKAQFVPAPSQRRADPSHGESREARLESMRRAAAVADEQRAAKHAAAAALGAAEEALGDARRRMTAGTGGGAFLASTAASMVTGGGDRILESIRAAGRVKQQARPGLRRG
jgi:hypothetical protein